MSGLERRGVRNAHEPDYRMHDYRVNSKGGLEIRHQVSRRPLERAGGRVPAEGS